MFPSVGEVGSDDRINGDPYPNGPGIGRISIGKRFRYGLQYADSFCYGKENMEIITSEGGEIKRYTPSDSDAPGKAGRRVGIAYELEDGKIVYIPE